MKMLILRKGRPAGDARAVVPIVRTKNRKYGLVLDEHWLSIRRDVMITGANAAGKTRWLMRLHAGAAAIWRDRPAILLRAVRLDAAPPQTLRLSDEDDDDDGDDDEQAAAPAAGMAPLPPPATNRRHRNP